MTDLDHQRRGGTEGLRRLRLDVLSDRPFGGSGAYVVTVSARFEEELCRRVADARASTPEEAIARGPVRMDEPAVLGERSGRWNLIIIVPMTVGSWLLVLLFLGGGEFRAVPFFLWPAILTSIYVRSGHTLSQTRYELTEDSVGLMWLEFPLGGEHPQPRLAVDRIPLVTITAIYSGGDRPWRRPRRPWRDDLRRGVIQRRLLTLECSGEASLLGGGRGVTFRAYVSPGFLAGLLHNWALALEAADHPSPERLEKPWVGEWLAPTVLTTAPASAVSAPR